MNSLQLQWFVVALFLFSSIQSKKVCDFTDVECMTRGANHVYKTLVAGIEGFAESSDPLHMEEINGNLQELKYKLTNITTTGLSNCIVTRLICRPKESTFDYFLRCPQLVFNADYEVKGTFGAAQLNAKGITTVTADDYEIMYKGVYGKLIDEKDHTSRVFIKSFDIDTNPKGKLTFEATDLLNDNKEGFELVKRFMNENWKAVEKLLRTPTIEKLLTKFIQNYSAVLRMKHLDELVPKE